MHGMGHLSWGSAKIAVASDCGRHVGLFEILAFKEEGLAGDLGKRIRKAVTEIQARRVSAFTEVEEGLASDMRLLDRERFDDDACPAEKNIALTASVRPNLTFNNDGELKEACSAHPAAVGGVDELDEESGLGFSKKDCRKRGGI